MSLLKAQPNAPRSFLERGVSVPFTTAQLSGARLRRLTRIAGSLMDEQAKGEPLGGFATMENGKPGIEVVVPNPSGGRGVYLMLWSNVGSLCRPTLHDVALCDYLLKQTNQMLPLTPTMVRKAARDAALRGLAGRPAAHAAQKAAEAEVLQIAATRRALILALLGQTEQAGQPPPHLLGEAELEQRAAAALAGISQRLGKADLLVTRHFGQIAEALIDIGIGDTLPSARLPRLLMTMAQMRNELVPLAEPQKGASFIDASAMSALQIAKAIEAACGMAQGLLSNIHRQLRSIETLLGETIARPRLIEEMAERPGWIVDGWDRICDLWALARAQGEEQAGQAQTLMEIHANVPVLPNELEGWLGLAEGSTLEINARNAHVGSPWRPEENTQHRVARNEQLRAMAV